MRCHFIPIRMIYLSKMNFVILLKALLSVLLGYIPRSGIARSYGNAVFIFLEKQPYYFAQWLHCCALLLALHQDFHYLHIITIACYCLLSGSIHSSQNIGTTHMFKGLLYIQSVVYTHNRILFSL